MLSVLDRTLAKTLDVVLALLMTGLVACVFIQVVSRYLFDASVPWTEEGARYLLIYLTFVGAAVAVREHTHLRVDFLVARLPAAVQKVVGVATTIGVLVSGGLLLRYGVQYAQNAVGTVSPAIGQSIAWVYAVMPVAGGLIVLYGIRLLIRQLTGREPLVVDAHPQTTD